MRPEDDAPRAPWPEWVFDAAVLRGLDARAQREIEAAGTLRSVDAGTVIYHAGDAGASFFVVASGRVSLCAVRRGDDRERTLRTASIGESFGEESTAGVARRATATATESTTVAEIPVHIFRRAAARSGTDGVAERLESVVQRRATRDLLRTIAWSRDLPDRDVDLLLDTVTHHRFERGQAVYRRDDAATELWLVADGMVQLQIEDDDRLHVRAYLTRGDFFGDIELTEGTARASSAVASGACVLLAVPAAVFRALSTSHPGLVPSLRRVATDQHEGQRAIVGRAAANATQHVFRDLYRLQIARSLLVIDLESCVRCGHCAWACSEMYGTARLVRRGDKVVTRLGGDASAGSAPQSLMLPSSCQHCENPACMIDCPTGAIGRDPEGEVFIRDELCTGCGACAKACPWDNIQMDVRPITALRPKGQQNEYAEVAVKCDLCREYESPACVQSCPTESIFRLNPAEDLADVRELFRSAAPAGQAREKTRGPALLAGSAIAASGIGVVGAVMQARGLFRPERGLGLGAGVAAAITMLALLAYAIPKRGVRSWMRPRTLRAKAGGSSVTTASVVRPQLAIHVALGLLALGLALAHTPWPPLSGKSYGGATAVALLLTSIAGAWTALAYRFVPRRLARIERTAALPEDLAGARRELLDRLYREVSGRSDLVKKIVERILLPYAKSARGSLALLASGRQLRDEERALRARIDHALEGRGRERLAGLDELIRIVVELRSLPTQRALLGVLRVGLPLHIVTFAVASALLLVHVIASLWRLRG